MGFLNPIPAAGWGTAGSGSAPAPAEYGFRSPFLFAFGMAGNNTEAVVEEDLAERNSGGYLPGRGFGLARIGTLRTKDDIREAREKFGVIPRVAKVISQVAAQQADLLSLDEQQRLEHLERELELQGIEYEGHYLDLLNVMRERLIATEIGRRLKELQMLEEETVLILLVAASV